MQVFLSVVAQPEIQLLLGLLVLTSAAAVGVRVSLRFREGEVDRRYWTDRRTLGLAVAAEAVVMAACAPLLVHPVVRAWGIVMAAAGVVYATVDLRWLVANRPAV